MVSLAVHVDKEAAEHKADSAVELQAVASVAVVSLGEPLEREEKAEVEHMEVGTVVVMVGNLVVVVEVGEHC